MVLELLLFYSVVQKDTNLMGHRLLDEFGSFSAVVDAEFDDLIKVSGITKNSATLIKLIGEVSSYYYRDKSSVKRSVTTPQELADIVSPLFLNRKNEAVIAVCLSADYRLVGVEEISDGGIDFCFVKPRIVVQAAIKHNVSVVALAHNHLLHGGVLMPSAEDIKVTKQLIEVLKGLDITLFDHIIVSGERYISLIRGGIPYL